MTTVDRAPVEEAPDTALAWNVYGAGIDHIGRDGRPERVPVPRPRADQLLIRIDAVGLCFSDVKLLRLGAEHPKLYGRDLATNPTRLGHETSVTVIEVGKTFAITNGSAVAPGMLPLIAETTVTVVLSESTTLALVSCATRLHFT